MSPETIVITVIMVVPVGGYFVLMYFLPEWVGISGDKTKAIQKEHVASTENKDSASKPQEPNSEQKK